MNNSYQLENESIIAHINPMGAELVKLFSKKTNIDYLWYGTPEVWARNAPVLFPIVGKLKNNTYFYENQSYNLPQHGLARDLNFQLINQTSDEIAFSLKSNEQINKAYPFHFELIIKYKLIGNTIKVGYQVINKADSVMYFNIGGHPGFNIPNYETELEQFEIYFEKMEELLPYPLEGGLLKDSPTKDLFPSPTQTIGLSNMLFANDALVFNNLKSEFVGIRSKVRTDYNVQLNFKGFEWLGIWGKGEVPFVCLEPWCGHADFINHNQDISQKADTIALSALSEWSNFYQIAIN